LQVTSANELIDLEMEAISSSESEPSTAEPDSRDSDVQILEVSNPSQNQSRSPQTEPQPSVSGATLQHNSPSSSCSSTARPPMPKSKIPKAPPPPKISELSVSTKKDIRQPSSSPEPTEKPPPKKRKIKIGPKSFKLKLEAKEENRRKAAKLAEETRKAEEVLKIKKETEEQAELERVAGACSMRKEEKADVKKPQNEAAELQRLKAVEEEILEEKRARKEAKLLRRKKKEEDAELKAKQAQELLLKEKEKAEKEALEEQRKKELEKVTLKKEKFSSMSDETCQLQRKKPKKDSELLAPPLKFKINARRGTIVPSSEESATGDSDRENVGTCDNTANNKASSSSSFTDQIQSNRDVRNSVKKCKPSSASSNSVMRSSPSSSTEVHATNNRSIPGSSKSSSIPSKKKSCASKVERSGNNSSEKSEDSADDEVMKICGKKSSKEKNLTWEEYVTLFATQMEEYPRLELSPVFFEDSRGNFKLRKDAREMLRPKTVSKVIFQLRQSQELAKRSKTKIPAKGEFPLFTKEILPFSLYLLIDFLKVYLFSACQ